MKNVLKLSALALIITVCVIACDPSHKPLAPVETGKVDTAKKDATMVKSATTNVDTVKKKK